MTSPRVISADVVTMNLPEVMQMLAETITAQSDVGERYAVTITVTGPLTVEETVTALWARVRAVQIPVTEHVS